MCWEDPFRLADVLDFMLYDAQVSLSAVIPSFFLYGFMLLSGWIFCLAGTLPWDLPELETSPHICRQYRRGTSQAGCYDTPFFMDCCSIRRG